VSEQLLFLLKLCLLALLYLFFFRVLRAVWAELRAPAPVAGSLAGPATPARQVVPAAQGPAPAPAPPRRPPPELVVVEPPEHRGQAFPLGPEATIGRAAGCQVTVDDSFVSQVHARVFVRDGGWFVEDIGSTNGTLLNRQKVTGPVPIQRGDRLQVGGTTLELR
jgi:hypothetical protein